MIGRKVEVGEAARALHEKSFVLDCHTHFLVNGFLLRRRLDRRGGRPLVFNPLANAFDLEGARRGGLGAAGFAVWVPGSPLLPGDAAGRMADRVIDRYFAIVDECGGRVAHCENAGELRAASREGRLAAFLTVEGGHVLGGRLENVARLRARGVVMLTLTHLVSNGIADAAMSPLRPLGGLSPFGREVVREMESAGLIVDVAHCTRRAFFDVLEAAARPVVCSHTALRRWRDIERNLADDQVRAIAGAGGLVGVTLHPPYLGRAGRGIRAVARQARDMAELAGPSAVCIGSDIDGFTATPAGFRGAEDFPRLTQALLDEGFSAEETMGVLGDNFLRFFDRYRSFFPHQ